MHDMLEPPLSISHALAFVEWWHAPCSSQLAIQKVVQVSTPASISANFANFWAAAGAFQAKISQLLADKLLSFPYPLSENI